MTTIHRLSVLVVLVLVGCVSVDPGESFLTAEKLVIEGVGEELLCHLEDEEAASSKTKELLADGLTVKESTQVALLNNRFLRAEFYSIGVAHADFVQSGLFSNPSLSWALGFPSGGGLASLDGSVVQNIAELWQIPIRKQVAKRELNRVILEVARSANEMVLDVRVTYFRAVAAKESLALAEENLQIAKQLLEMALDRQEAGGGNEIDVNVGRSEVLRSEVVVKKAALLVYRSRQELLELLGLSQDGSDIALLGSLLDAPSWSLTPKALLAKAWAHRLDFRAAQQKVEAAKQQVILERRLFLRVVEPGVAYERDQRKPGESTDYTVGPTLDFELPIFDQNQAQIARAEYELIQAENFFEALRISIVQAVRIAHQRAMTLSDLTRFYKERVLPQEEQSLNLAREAYRLGQTPFLSVLVSQQSLLAARQESLDTRRALANTLVGLEQVTGQPLESLGPSGAAVENENIDKKSSSTDEERR